MLDLPSNVKMGHWANKLPRWSRTPLPWSRFPPFPPICRLWLLTLSAQRARMQGVPNCWCLQARCALPASNLLPAGQGAVIRWGMWRQAPLLCSPCRTPIFRQWWEQVLSRVTVGRSVSGQRLVPSMRQRHCRGAEEGSLKCVAVSTLQYTMPHIPPQVQDTLLLLSLCLSPDPQDSVTPAPLHLSANPQTENHSSVLPAEGLKAHSPVNNPYVNPPVHQLVVVNKAANTIHSPEEGPTKD